MGFVSYNEDLMERISDSLYQIEIELTAPNLDLIRARYVESALHSIRRVLEENLELATNPDINMAHAISELEEEIIDLRNINTITQKNLDKANTELTSLRQDHKICLQRLESVESENTKLQMKLGMKKVPKRIATVR